MINENLKINLTINQYDANFFKAVRFEKPESKQFMEITVSVLIVYFYLFIYFSALMCLYLFKKLTTV